MLKIHWNDRFKNKYQKWIIKHSELENIFKQRLELFSENPFNPILKTHCLSGILKGLWAWDINYKYRLVFKFVNGYKEAVFINIGTHDEVY